MQDYTTPYSCLLNLEKTNDENIITNTKKKRRATDGFWRKEMS